MTKAIVILYLSGLMVMKEGHLCFVVGAHMVKEGKETLPSAIQLKHEVK